MDIISEKKSFSAINFSENVQFVAWGLGLAAVMLVVDYLLTHIVPEESMDDGGINDLYFEIGPYGTLL